MDVGHIVRFASQPYPFIVETRPCLDLACRCSVMGLTLREMRPSGASPGDCLTFNLRVCLRTWTEHDPPPRSLEVETLAREFMARFPTPRIQELSEEFERTRAVQRRRESFSFAVAPDELVTYSELLREGGGIHQGECADSFFFVFEGREFLIEDHYCANPACDCQQVHLEFWERVHAFSPQHRIKIVQRLMVTFSLTGKLVETRFNEESASTTKYLVQAWQRRGGDQLRECRRRYDVIKTIGARSFPTSVETPVNQNETRRRVDTDPATRPGQRVAQKRPTQPIRRNDPCPCGSGLKFKRCCARRSTIDR